MLAGAVGFVAIGVWMTGLFNVPPDADKAWFGWVAILVFGPCGALIARQIFDEGDQIRVDAAGIYWRRWSDAVIPWNAIQSVGVGSVERQKFVCLELVAPELYPSTTMLGRLARANKAMGFGDITLSTTGTDRAHADLLAAIEAHGNLVIH